MGETLRFDRAPGLAGIFARAVVGGRVRGQESRRELPDVTAEQLGVRLEPDPVVDYSHVCGFSVGTAVPVTYPHVLGFPLQAALMSRPDFPLPLVGLVHLVNSLRWSGPLRVGDRLDLRVHATGLRGHRRGRLVDLVTEGFASGVTGGPPVWRGVSTYLARGAGDEHAVEAPPPSVEALRRIGGGVRWRIDEGAGRRYAAVSGDVNPIHLHALTARALGFDRAIAHGMFTYARVLGALGAAVPSSGTSTVWFRQPVTLPSTVLLKVAPDHRLAAVLPAKGDGEHLVVTL